MKHVFLQIQTIAVQKIAVNEGGAFNNDVPGAHRVIIPISGYYYMFLDMAATFLDIKYRPVGTKRNKYLAMKLCLHFISFFLCKRPKTNYR